MAKGDDAIAKHRNKAIRKRNRRAGADTLEAIQGVQAAKRRRKAGTRRVCEGMCYALPTPEDPFLEKRERKLKLEKKREAARKAASLEPVTFVENLSYRGKEYQGGEDAGESDNDVTAGYDKLLKRKRTKEGFQEATKPAVHQKRRKLDSDGAIKQKAAENGHNVQDSFTVDGSNRLPSKSTEATPHSNGHTGGSGELLAGVTDEVVLAVISEAGLMSKDLRNGKGLRSGTIPANPLAKPMWEAHSLQVDVLASCHVSVESRILGLVASSVAHVKAQKLKNDVLHQPIVLILVVSQEQGLRARRVFRPLKTSFGISSVCLHDGTSLERQIDGLTTQKRDIVVATPDRLCDLLSAQAITLSSVSLFAVDDLAEMIERGLQSYVSKIKEYVNPGARKVVLSSSYPERAVLIARQLVADPVARVISSDKSPKCSSACITQTVAVFTDVNKRMNKMVKIAHQFWEKHESKRNWTILVVVENEETVQAVLPELVKIGYKAVAMQPTQTQKMDEIVKQIREGTVEAVVSTAKHAVHTPLEKMQLVINFSFPGSMEVYEQILTGMARNSVEGVLHTFCTASMASSASQLVQLLQTCLQPVPQALQMLATAASVVQRGLAE